MWFKNLQILQLDESKGYQPELLAVEMESMLFKPCGKVVASSAGWVAPVGGEDAPLVYGSNGFMSLCLKTQEKVLPAAVVREQLVEQVRVMEEEQGRKVFRKDKERMKDEIYYTLLSQAFTQSNRTYAYIDPKANWVIVDAASPKRLETFLKAFAESVKSYKIVVPEVHSVSAVLTGWLKNNHFPRNFSLADSCVMEDLSDKNGSVRLRNKDLLADNVLAFLREGSQVTQITLTWLAQLQFTVKQDFSLSGVRFLDAVQDLAKDGLTESPEERFAADFVIMAETLRNFLADLMPHFAVTEEVVAA